MSNIVVQFTVGQGQSAGQFRHVIGTDHIEVLTHHSDSLHKQTAMWCRCEGSRCPGSPGSLPKILGLAIEKLVTCDHVRIIEGVSIIDLGKVDA